MSNITVRVTTAEFGSSIVTNNVKILNKNNAIAKFDEEGNIIELNDSINGSLPNANVNETLRYDGNNWVNNSNVLFIKDLDNNTGIIINVEDFGTGYHEMPYLKLIHNFTHSMSGITIAKTIELGYIESDFGIKIRQYRVDTNQTLSEKIISLESSLTQGATGTFTTADDKNIIVENGLIKEINNI